MKKLALIAVFLVSLSNESFAENYYVKSKGYSSNPEPDPPQYVHQLNRTGIEKFKDINWIDTGLAYRMRFEHRKNDYRRPDDRTDNPFLSRTQVYFGIKNIIDPVRFAVELQDSRRHNSKYPRHTRDINKLDVFQAYAELYFENPAFLDRPLSLRAGRMAFEVMDRKLISRDDWGNTGTNFQGFRATLGKNHNDWSFDSFALQPMVKVMDEADHRNENQWVYGAILNWRKWSDTITLQPFYLQLSQDQSASALKRRIHSPGLRFYGTVGENFDYGIIGLYQFGESEGLPHRASAYSAEVGYSLKHEWKPRFSLTYGYASGDKNPNDGKNQRFERFYGFNRPWSNNNHIEWENLETVKTRFELQPEKKLRLEGSYSYYWLASSTDSWVRANLQDSSGASGDFMGRDYDFRAHYEISKHLRTTFGYAHFIPGKFPKNLGRNGTSDFIYIELNFSLFGRSADG